jgi:hypothetical protein
VVLYDSLYRISYGLSLHLVVKTRCDRCANEDRTQPEQAGGSHDDDDDNSSEEMAARRAEYEEALMQPIAPGQNE